MSEMNRFKETLVRKARNITDQPVRIRMVHGEDLELTPRALTSTTPTSVNAFLRDRKVLYPDEVTGMPRPGLLYMIVDFGTGISYQVYGDEE